MNIYIVLAVVFACLVFGIFYIQNSIKKFMTVHANRELFRIETLRIHTDKLESDIKILKEQVKELQMRCMYKLNDVDPYKITVEGK